MEEKELSAAVAGMSENTRRLIVVTYVLSENLISLQNVDGSFTQISPDGQEIAKYLIATNKYQDLVQEIMTELNENKPLH